MSKYLEVSYHIIFILLSGRFEEEFPIFPVIQGLGPMAWPVGLRRRRKSTN